jgi:hypothetical protein
MPLGVPTNITQTGNGQNLYLLESDAGSGGAGVVQLVAGTGVTLSPPSGEGIVTINATLPPAPPVTRLLAGTNVTLTPSTGLGEVTINASGGGGGAVSSVSGSGAGINVTPTSGAVVVSNTGVTSLVAGTNVNLSGSTGAVTVSVATSTNNPFLPIVSLDGQNCSVLMADAPFITGTGTEYPGCVRVQIPGNQTGTFSTGSFINSGWFAIPYIAGTDGSNAPKFFAVNTDSCNGATGIFNIQNAFGRVDIRGVSAWPYFINGEKATAPGGFPAKLSCLKFQNTNDT